MKKLKHPSEEFQYAKKGNFIYGYPTFKHQPPYQKIIAEVEGGYLTVGVYRDTGEVFTPPVDVKFFGEKYVYLDSKERR